MLILFYVMFILHHFTNIINILNQRCCVSLATLEKCYSQYSIKVTSIIPTEYPDPDDEAGARLIDEKKEKEVNTKGDYFTIQITYSSKTS